MIKHAEQDTKIIGITGAMPSGTGLNLFEKKFPDRTFDVGTTRTKGEQTNIYTIDYITLASTGNATDFGDLLYIQGFGSSTMSATRAVWFGGYGGTPGGSPAQGYKDWIQYQAMATLGNSVDFGDLTFANSGTGACTNGTRGCVGVGTPGSGVQNVIDYITIASTGNGTDFGDLTVARSGVAACASETRGVFGSGQTPSNSNVLDYITIASTGNATDFGNLLESRAYLACSSGT